MVEQDKSKFAKAHCEACLKSITNVMYCPKNSLSSANLIPLIDKDQLISGKCATKTTELNYSFTSEILHTTNYAIPYAPFLKKSTQPPLHWKTLLIELLTQFSDIFFSWGQNPCDSNQPACQEVNRVRQWEHCQYGRSRSHAKSRPFKRTSRERVSSFCLW